MLMLTMGLDIYLLIIYLYNLFRVFYCMIGTSASRSGYTIVLSNISLFHFI